jgi:hypothetical protein
MLLLLFNINNIINKINMPNPPVEFAGGFYYVLKIKKPPPKERFLWPSTAPTANGLKK